MVVASALVKKTTTTRVWILLLICLWILPTPAPAMATSAAKISSRVAIIGGGVAGCASARRLAQLASSAQITVYEIGRGPGGRASTRKTRSLPHLYINHGAPYADIRSELAKSLVKDASAVAFEGVKGSLDSLTGRFLREEPLTNDNVQYVTGVGGEMSEIATSLLSGMPSIETKYKTMVRGLSRENGEWKLLDKNEKIIGSADWLVVAGSGIAHPRWSNTFGGEPPLITAENQHPDPNLRKALDAIAEQQASPVVAVFFSCSGAQARKWLLLDYNVADVKGSSILSRVVIQGGMKRKTKDEKEDDGDNDEWCSVVLHSTEDFALGNSGVYGASSSAARVGDAASDASREEALIGKMVAALNQIPGMPSMDLYSDDTAQPPSNSGCDYGPVLHRWGNAFPKGKALPEDLSFVPSSKVAFCGDYVAATSSGHEARFGSFESALLSGTVAGEKIAKACQDAGAS